ncbi:toll/interleukin-1 receptor domain-containing protein [Amycolatopsis solani]|uniref:toll/interleukin-1 receptor domain-containing protein n=1 Tax=Amycolatopsis solani TaxID=3028615 RepID=UPI0025B03DBD|nr:toll/interleukin-1 receptor domain-containing protein [Amycolatopsis sp. MEP2-6]
MSHQPHPASRSGTDLFISYARTSAPHREWVRLLAAHLKAIGFDVLIDADDDYGDSLTGFMRRVTEAEHVLLIVDDNYVERADKLPDSGVGVENRWISEVYEDRPPTWLSVLFKGNLGRRLPAWLAHREPRGFPFDRDESKIDDFPGSEQIEDLWRWIEGLPANRDSQTPIATLRERAARLERQARKGEPSQYRSPALTGQTCFKVADAPDKVFRWGLSAAEFAFKVSECGADSIYVYSDPVMAVGVVRSTEFPDSDLEQHLTPGRTVVAHIGKVVVLLNEHGRLAVVEILDVQREQTRGTYVAPHVTFRWRVVETS